MDDETHARCVAEQDRIDKANAAAEEENERRAEEKEQQRAKVARAVERLRRAATKEQRVAAAAAKRRPPASGASASDDARRPAQGPRRPRTPRAASTSSWPWTSEVEEELARHKKTRRKRRRSNGAECRAAHAARVAAEGANNAPPIGAKNFAAESAFPEASQAQRAAETGTDIPLTHPEIS